MRTDHAVWVGARQARARDLPAEAPADGWQRLSCGAGAKGPRWYGWAARPINCLEPEAYRRWLLVRRHPTKPTEVAYFVCGEPPGTTVQELVEVSGARWAVEDLFELGKGACGLDEYEVRSWVGWYRHVTLSLYALAVIRSRAPAGRRKKEAWASSR